MIVQMVVASFADLLKIVRVLKSRKNTLINKQVDRKMKRVQASCNENAGQCKQRSVSTPAVITSCFIVRTKQHLKHLLLLDRVNTSKVTFLFQSYLCLLH